MKKIILILFLSLLANPFLQAQNVDISGYARNYTGVLFNNGDFSILQNTLNLNFEKRGGKVAFKANPMLYSYNTDSLKFNMREIYLDLYFDKFDIRIGKQQVVWGKADGVFITDVVSPLNLTEFLLPDFDEIRSGVYATKLDYYIGNNTFEVIWIPVFTPIETPASNSIWYIQPSFPVQPSFDNSKKSVNPSLENSEIFAKFTGITSLVDFEIMGGYTWDDVPVMHANKTFGVDPNTHTPVLTALNIRPEYSRLTLAGGSFSSQIKGLIFRGEAAYYVGKNFQTEDPQAVDALVEKDYLHYVLGLDFNIKSVKFSTQFIQQHILDYEAGILDRETENTMTFLVHADVFRETLHLELFSYLGLSNSDALIRPKITYDYDDSFSILLGSNLFVGDENGRFGQYKDNSMIYAKIKYSF
jgi:hypothetical protein